MEFFRLHGGLDFEEAAVHAGGAVVGLLEAEEGAVGVTVGGVAVGGGDGFKTVVAADFRHCLYCGFVY